RQADRSGQGGHRRRARQRDAGLQEVVAVDRRRRRRRRRRHRHRRRPHQQRLDQRHADRAPTAGEVMRNALLALLLIGCGTNDLTLHYKLDGIAPTDVVRVATRVDIDGSDARSFYVDQPFRQVAQGIGYEVRDDDGDGKRTLMITHDATLGYVFAPTFDFRLLPPVGESAPPLSITARAVGVSDMIGETMALGAKFADDAKLAVDLTDARC